MEEKKNTGMVVVIIILMLIITGLCSYIVYDKVYKQKNNEEKIENKDAGNVKNDTDDTALFDKLIKKYNIENDNVDGGCFINAKLFDSVDSMKDLDVAFILLGRADTSTIKQEKSSLIKEDEKEGYSVISKATYEDLFKNYFGVDPKVKSKEVATLNEINECEGYILVEKDGNYYAKIGCGCEASPRKDIITSKKRVDSNTITIDKKYYTYDDMSNNKLYIGEKDIKTTCDISKEECFSNYNDYFDTIRYTFTKQSDGNYYIQSIKSLKDAKEYK